MKMQDIMRFGGECRDYIDVKIRATPVVLADVRLVLFKNVI